MATWLLQQRQDAPKNLWRYWYDGCRDNFVVVAPDEQTARQYAHEMGGVENYNKDGITPWLDDTYTTCVKINPRKQGVVFFEDMTQ